MRVYNYSWATQEDMRDMQSVAVQLLSQAGVGLRWIQCSPVLEEAGLSSQCGLPLLPAIFQLMITNAAHGLRHTALGSTVPGTSVLHVSYDKSRDFAGLGNLPVGRVLAYAAIHEIGHLIIGVEHHAVNGILKARFGSEDLEDMDRGWLVFTPEQSRTLRSRVSSYSKQLTSK